MKRFLLLFLFVARLTADSALTTATENKALYATTVTTTADIGGNTTVGGTLAVTGALTTTTNATIGGLLLQPTHSLTASTTLTAEHQFVFVNDSAGDVVLTLADPTTLTNVNVTLQKRSGTNRTTVSSTALINGIANTLPLPSLEAMTLRSTGLNWYVTSVSRDTYFTIPARTATEALTVGDVFNSYSDTAGNITVTLPSATNFSTLGRIYYHKKIAGGNTTTLDPEGSETIGGAATLSLGTLGGVAIYSDLVNWHVLADSGLGGGSGDALVANPLSQFAATTSAQLAGVISDETGSGALMFGPPPTYVSAGAIPPFATAGATAATTTLATTGISIDEYAFDASTDEKVGAFHVAAPSGWNASTLTAEFVWRSTATTGNCVWTIAARLVRDGDQVDAAFGTAVSVTDGTPGTANYQAVSAASGTITPSGTYGAGCQVYFIVTRDADNGSDTLAVDALLGAVKINWQ